MHNTFYCITLPIYDKQMYVNICVDIHKIFTSETDTVLLYLIHLYYIVDHGGCRVGRC